MRTLELREERHLGRLPGGGAVFAGLWHQIFREEVDEVEVSARKAREGE